MPRPCWKYDLFLFSSFFPDADRTVQYTVFPLLSHQLFLNTRHATMCGPAMIPHIHEHDTCRCIFPLPVLWADLSTKESFAGLFVPTARAVFGCRVHTEVCNGSCCGELGFASSVAIFCPVESPLFKQNQSYRGCGSLPDHFSIFLPPVVSTEDLTWG